MLTAEFWEPIGNDTIVSFMKRQRKVWNVLAMMGVLAITALMASCGSSESKKDEQKVDYLAVQIDKDDSWSIIDANGNVVVDREYDKDNVLSSVYDGGIYWVQSNGKFRLFSIDSPKKSLTDDEYDKVTIFREGRAFASVTGQPILMLDEKGNHLKTLSKDVARAFAFFDGMAPYQDQEGKWGFLNKSGDIQIPATYSAIHNFGSGVCCVYTDAEMTAVTLIDKKGNAINSWSKQKYNPRQLPSEGKIGVEVDGDSEHPSVAYLDVKGNELFGKFAGYSTPECYYGGYAVLRNFMTEEYTVINDKGEKIIRSGKYKSIDNMGNATFGVKKGEKYGVVDAEDNALVDFDYDGICPLRLGENYIMISGNYFVVVTPKGEEIKKAEFRTFNSGGTSGYAEYVDLQAIADTFTQDVSTKGVVCCNGQEDMASIAKSLKLELDSVSPYASSVSTSFHTSWCTMERILHFTGNLKNELFHEETSNDGWFEYTTQVSDGFEWNPDAKLERMVVSVNIPKEYNEAFISCVKKSILAKGFTQSDYDGEFLCGSGDNAKRIIINSEYDTDEVSMDFFIHSNTDDE